MTQRQTPTAPPPTVPAAEAAQILGVSLRTLDRYQAAGMITPCPVPQRPRHFRLTDIKELTEPKKRTA